MQPTKILQKWLTQYANEKHYLFTTDNLRTLFEKQSDGAIKTFLNRATKTGLLTRVCRGLYLYSPTMPKDGLLLFHAAATIRANHFNYISLETALSEAGVISQLPMNWITIMSSGRSSILSCGEFGNIEFIHTEQKPASLQNKLNYDVQCGLWRANVALAIRDMKKTQRNCDLINWEIANELI